MEVNSVLAGIQNSYVTSTKKVETKAVANTELSEAEKLEVFKKKIWKEIDSWPRCSSISESIQITDSAFKRMMNDEDFKNKMMKLMKEDADVGRPPIVAGITWIDENGYRGISYNDSSIGVAAFEAHSKSKNSFYVKKGKRNDVEDAWEKVRQNKIHQQKKRDKEYFEEEYLKRYYRHQEEIEKLYSEKLISK